MCSIKFCASLPAPLICKSKNLPCEQRAIFHAHVRGCESYVTHTLRDEEKENAYVYVHTRSDACAYHFASFIYLFLLRRALSADATLQDRVSVISMLSIIFNGVGVSISCKFYRTEFEKPKGNFAVIRPFGFDRQIDVMIWETLWFL